MKYLVEGYSYQQNVLEQVFAKGICLYHRTGTGLCNIDHVGYFYQPQTKCCYYIIPKVFLDKQDKVMGRYLPNTLLRDGDDALSREEQRFFHKICVWTHQAIKLYAATHADSGIVYSSSHLHVDASRQSKPGSLFDVILALLDFHKENKNLIIRSVALSQKSGNKVNWHKTISKGPTVINDEEVLYPRVFGTKKEIDYNEQLLVIFYSVLYYIKKVFRFNVTININFNLITGREFRRYLDGLGIVRLKQIRHRYFSDKFLYLWKLCCYFFEFAHDLTSSDQSVDCLLVKDFNIVFEAITDELLGDSDIDKKLKEQPDGKLVDHIFIGRSLLRSGNIYYIVDSKYYKKGTSLGETAIYKQYTYARNAITYNICHSATGDDNSSLVPSYRDDWTEGYDVTPNFFLSATANFDNPNHAEEGLSEHNPSFYNISHFKNRLFDRDTLWVLHYDINFLFLLQTYTSKNETTRQEFKKRVRTELRKVFVNHLCERYRFYRSAAPVDPQCLQDSITGHLFKMLNGKVITTTVADGTYLILALESCDQENSNILNAVREIFPLVDFKPS